jgi:excisionase family DNA binding protein
MIDDNDVLTLEEVAFMLKMPPSSIYRMTAARTIPFMRLGRRLRFSRVAIDAWLDAQDVPMRDVSATRDVQDASENTCSRAGTGPSRAFDAPYRGNKHRQNGNVPYS